MSSPVCRALLFATLLCATPAVAQDYPSRPIKLIVPLAAGGGIDFTARVMAQKLSDVIGQQVVVVGVDGLDAELLGAPARGRLDHVRERDQLDVLR